MARMIVSSILVQTLLVCVTAAPVLCQIEPVGKSIGLVQFDAVTEISCQVGQASSAIFARYWVDPNFYAFAVVWTEPRGGSVLWLKGRAVMIDSTGLSVARWFTDAHEAQVKRHLQPFGPRGPFRWAGGVYNLEELRFTHTEMLARRVFAKDLDTIKHNASRKQILVDLARGEHQVFIMPTRLKVEAGPGRLHSIRLLDKEQQLLSSIRYVYSQDSKGQRLSKLIAELPTRPEKLAVDRQIRLQDPNTGRMTQRHVSEVGYVYHKGGRTCTVIYGDVELANHVVRLPVKVDVRVTSNNTLLRSARLMNFRLVNMTKDQVWKAAIDFASHSEKDLTYYGLIRKYDPAGPPPLMVKGYKVDPNDMAFINSLIGKYPVPEDPNPPSMPQPKMPTDRQEAMAWSQRFGQEMARLQEQYQKTLEEYWRQYNTRPRPTRKDIEPNDYRAIRNLLAYYAQQSRELVEKTKQQLRAEGRYNGGPVPVPTTVASQLRKKLRRIISYHRRPVLPEDLPPSLDPNDLATIRQLKDHYKGLLANNERWLGGQLRAMYALMRLGGLVKDYVGLADLSAQQLELLSSAGLHRVYLDCGSMDVQDLILRRPVRTGR